MTDTSGTLAPEPQTTEPVGATPDGTETEYKVHPSWEEPLSVLPENLRGPIVEKIRSDERNVQKQIEAARANSTPEEWRAFVADAQSAGLQPAEIIEAYNDNQDLVDRLRTDPWGFIDTLNANLDAAVKAGTITPRQAAEARADAAQLAGAAAEQLANDDPNAARIAEIEQRLDREEQTRQQEQRQQQEAIARQQQEALADDFQASFHQTMIDNGFATRDAQGKLAAVVAPATIQQIARTADEILYQSNDRLSPKEAIAKAVEQLRGVVTAAGGTLPTGPAAAPAAQAQQPHIPIGGGSASIQAPAAPKFEGTPQEQRRQREAAMIQTLKELHGES